MKIFIKLLLFILISYIAILGCKKTDPCKDRNCYNGNICNDGKCECPTNFTKIGERCTNLNDTSIYGYTSFINYNQYRCFDTVELKLNYKDTIPDKEYGGTLNYKDFSNSGITYTLYDAPDGDSIYANFFVWPTKCLVNGRTGYADLHAKFNKERTELKGEVYWYEYIDDIHYTLFDKDPILFHK